MSTHSKNPSLKALLSNKEWMEGSWKCKGRNKYQIDSYIG